MGLFFGPVKKVQLQILKSIFTPPSSANPEIYEYANRFYSPLDVTGWTVGFILGLASEW